MYRGVIDSLICDYSYACGNYAGIILGILIADTILEIIEHNTGIIIL